MELAQKRVQSRQVEYVSQALAVGLQHYRELAIGLGDLEQGLRLQPLLPQRGPLPGVGAGKEQRAGRVLAEARAEESRRTELADDQLLELLRVDQHEVRGRRLVGVGEVYDDPVVRPDGVGLETGLVA